ncbi:unnamed protein product [Didymodactylos carnosus]|uniref:Thioredoxin domain-containing protein n=1 Tax=Didymodactylos carnosus TaxID=1234261 RepID=A0A8S2FBN7_9BILA|nr:unnamed protein product [Didymodactylos carnosus]CAF4215081.1 unnamed protein product [Didymodactylos carnosus]
MTLKVGDRAPEFKLFNQDKQEVSLKDLTSKGNVVILFFPLAFTPTCTTELCSMRDDIAKYKKLNATIVGISVDSLFTLEKYRQEQQLPFDLLSDFNKEIARAYDSLYEDFPRFNMKGVTKRSAFVIDKNGIIQHVDVLQDPSKLPDFNAVEKALEKCGSA